MLRLALLESDNIVSYFVFSNFLIVVCLNLVIELQEALDESQ